MVIELLLILILRVELGIEIVIYIETVLKVEIDENVRIRWYHFQECLKRETEEEVSDGGSSKLSKEEEYVEEGRRGYKGDKYKNQYQRSSWVKCPEVLK